VLLGAPQPVGALRQLGDRDTEAMRDLHHGRPARVGGAHLRAVQREQGDVGRVREALLAQLAISAELADGLPEDWIRGSSHDEHIADYSTFDPYRSLCIANDEEVPRATLDTPPGPAQEGLAPMHSQRICDRRTEVVE
jgi:hypothetical protein